MQASTDKGKAPWRERVPRRRLPPGGAPNVAGASDRRGHANCPVVPIRIASRLQAPHEFGWEDPSDPAKATRVETIMLVEETAMPLPISV
jgi:hypothetical protein